MAEDIILCCLSPGKYGLYPASFETMITLDQQCIKQVTMYKHKSYILYSGGGGGGGGTY